MSIVIAIDGASATGKGTLANGLIQKYDLVYLDTGALYRAIGYEMIESGLDPENVDEATRIAQNLPAPKMATLQNNPDIRTEVIGSAASKVSAIPGVRKALFDFQQKFANNPVHADGKPAKGAVLDGRDIGTVICPNAQIKIFLTATPEIRAQRRLKDLQLKGIHATFDGVLSDLVTRDKRDSERATAPLKPAEDALILDTSDLSIDDVMAKIVNYIEGHIQP